MGLVIDKDGKETIGGIAAIRNAFQDAAGGKLACTDATLSYGEGNAQVLTFAGHWHADGRTFRVTSNPILPGVPLAGVAASLARSLIQGGA
jgi:hypothetical protein